MDKKAKLTGEVLYSDDQPFSGWFVVGLVPPLRGVVPYQNFVLRDRGFRVDMPQWVTFRVRNGKYDDNARLRYNSEFSPANTQYVGYFVDHDGAVMATEATFVVNTPEIQIDKTIVAPVVGPVNPTLCANIRVCAPPSIHIPTGVADGVNSTFTLPKTGQLILVYWNGQLLLEGIGYTITGTTLEYEPGYEPLATSDYWVLIFD